MRPRGWHPERRGKPQLFCAAASNAPPWRTHPEHPRYEGAPTCSLPCCRHLPSNDFATRAIISFASIWGWTRLSDRPLRTAPGPVARSRRRRTTVTHDEPTAPSASSSVPVAARATWRSSSSTSRRHRCAAVPGSLLPRPTLGPLAAAVPHGRPELPDPRARVGCASASRSCRSSCWPRPPSSGIVRGLAGRAGVDARRPATSARWTATMFNAAMSGLVGAAGALVYALLGGVEGDAGRSAWAPASSPGTSAGRSWPPTSSPACVNAALLVRCHPLRPGHPLRRPAATGAQRVRGRLRRLRRHRAPLRHPVVPGRPRRLQCAPRPRAAARGPVGLHPVRRGAALARTDHRHPRHRARAPRSRPPWTAAGGPRSSRSGSPRSSASRPARSARCAMPRRCTRSATWAWPPGSCAGHPASLSPTERRVIDGHCVVGRPDDRGHRLPRGREVRHPPPARALRRRRATRRPRRAGHPDRRAHRRRDDSRSTTSWRDPDAGAACCPVADGGAPAAGPTRVASTPTSWRPPSSPWTSTDGRRPSPAEVAS